VIFLSEVSRQPLDTGQMNIATLDQFKQHRKARRRPRRSNPRGGCALGVEETFSHEREHGGTSLCPIQRSSVNLG
jgi:hypothetical protein